MFIFFHGWRRKFGFITLMIAAMMTVGSFRSLVRDDSTGFRLGNRRHILRSYDLHLLWWSWKSDPHSRYDTNGYGWQSYPVNHKESQWKTIDLDRRIYSTWHPDLDEWIISYAAMILPLTLISAYLMLWTPRTPRTGSKQNTGNAA